MCTLTTRQWIPEPVPSLELSYGVEKKVEQKVAGTPVIKKKI